MLRLIFAQYRTLRERATCHGGTTRGGPMLHFVDLAGPDLSIRNECDLAIRHSCDREVVQMCRRCDV
jgi:hypothetical protein